MSTVVLPVSEAKQRFTELVKESEAMYDRFVVTRNGKEAAIIMSVEEYTSLLETIDILGNKKEIKAIAAGATQARTGKTLSLKKYLADKRKAPKRNR